MRLRPLLSAALFSAILASGPAVAQAPRGLGDLGAARAAETGDPVDVELVLAVDVSWSMDLSEQAIQREGYAAAFRSEEVQRAITEGNHGRVAVTYIEWAGAFSQSIVVPWTLIDSKESAESFAYALGKTTPIRARRTSIASAIDFSAPLFDNNGYAGQRRVIDISGDGPNNQGPLVTQSRDDATERGITINGLPLMTTDTAMGSNWGSISNLDEYYADCVIGGPGAFSIPVTSWDQFPLAVRRKLVLELAGSWPNMRRDAGGDDVVIRIQNEEPTDCMVGESMWQDRQRFWMDGVQ